jgi:non-specific serine/threonine protein kinase/serine/threonine-protein kinase
MTQESDDDRTELEGTGFDGNAGASGDGGALAEIGPYRFIEELGRGGMGAVWLAEQLEPVRRKVAVKLMRASTLSALDEALFEVERQTLAQMSHPCIAQVFDAGKTADGRPWFAMEWVPGQPINAYCNQQRLRTGRRIELFAQICRGVQHAHQRGIIHRDLKPANVLVRTVDGRALPKIIDFGVATSVYAEAGEIRATSTDRAGTRAYMSPEQQAGDVSRLDTRTDIYALGVMLFELLTGRRPPDSGDRETLHTFHAALATRQGGHVDDGSPGAGAFSAAGGLERELRYILARALAPDRDRRYASAEDLARDLERYRSGRPVSAVPQTATYRIGKFVARHRLAIGAGALAVVALVTGLMLAVWGLMQAQAERDRARLAAARAEQTAGFVQNMLSSIDPVYASGQDTALMRRVLDDAAARADEELADQPEILAEVALTIGSAYKGIGEDAAAETHLARAVELSATLPDRPRLGLRAENQLAELLSRLGRPEDGLARSERLLQRATQRLPEDDELRLQIRSVHAHLLQQVGRYDDAEAAIRPVIASTRSAADAPYREIRADAMRTLAQLHSDRMQLEQAHAVYDRVLGELSGREDSAARLHRALALNDKAVVYLRQQRYAEAEPLLRESLAGQQALFGEDHPMTRSVVVNLGGSLRQQGRPEEALPFYRRAHAGFVAQYGLRHPRALISQYNLGNCLRDLGRLDEALALQREALELGRQEMAGDAFLLGNFRLGLGRTELAAGNAEAAAALLREAASQIAEAAGEDHYRAAEARDFLARARAAMRTQSPDNP